MASALISPATILELPNNGYLTLIAIRKFRPARRASQVEAGQHGNHAALGTVELDESRTDSLVDLVAVVLDVLAHRFGSHALWGKPTITPPGSLHRLMTGAATTSAAMRSMSAQRPVTVTEQELTVLSTDLRHLSVPAFDSPRYVFPRPVGAGRSRVDGQTGSGKRALA